MANKINNIIPPLFGKHPAQIQHMSHSSNKQRYQHLIQLRLRMEDSAVIPFAYFDFFIGANVAYVIVAANDTDEPIIIKDDKDLFPSDTLITQLRLVIG